MTFKQRTCFYDGFWSPTTDTGSNSPAKPSAVMFYVGNESPLDVYINNTGLMWNLAKELKAGIIFAEHRYEGLSVPKLDGVKNCMAYVSSKLALADYALIIETLKYTEPWTSIYRDVPFIAFGGSYGGMLAGWIRTKYPHLVAGAIAGSAPIFGVPMLNSKFGKEGLSLTEQRQSNGKAGTDYLPSFNNLLDSSSMFVSRSLTKAGGLKDDSCMQQFKAFWILLKYVLEHPTGSATSSVNQRIADAMKLCDAPKSSGASSDWRQIMEVLVMSADGGNVTLTAPTDYSSLVSYLQDAFFFMAEGNYPFPSDYITGAVGGHMNVKLPAWPMKQTCAAMQSTLQDSGRPYEKMFTFTKEKSEGTSPSGTTQTHRSSTMGDKPLLPPTFDLVFENLKLHVSGSNVTQVSGELNEELFLRLATAVAKGVGVWYNVTGTLRCLDWKGRISASSQSDDGDKWNP